MNFEDLVENATANFFKSRINTTSLSLRTLLSAKQVLSKDIQCFAIVIVYKNDKVFKHNVIDSDVMNQLKYYDPECDTEDGYIQELLGMHLVRCSTQRSDTLSIFSIDSLGNINSNVQTIKLTNAKSY